MICFGMDNIYYSVLKEYVSTHEQELAVRIHLGQLNINDIWSTDSFLS